MSGTFDGPDPTGSGRALRPPPPARPALVELAAAMLIVGGIIGLIGVLGGVGRLPAGTEGLAVATVVLDIGQIVLGVLIRSGRAWLVAINVVAVLGFLDLLAGLTDALALLLAGVEIGVVAILAANRPWFEARARYRAGREEADPARGNAPAPGDGGGPTAGAT